MSVTEQALMEKIRQLPPQRLAEVDDFVEFLVGKTKKRAALDRLLEVAPMLEAAGAVPITEEEIAAEVKAVRAARHTQEQTNGSTG